MLVCLNMYVDYLIGKLATRLALVSQRISNALAIW